MIPESTFQRRFHAVTLLVHLALDDDDELQSALAEYCQHLNNFLNIQIVPNPYKLQIRSE